MSAQLVINYIIDLQGININTLTDSDFSSISWLNEREPVYNMKGEKVSKSYYFENKKEAIRIEYSKIVGDYQYNGVVYPNVYLGLRKTMNWIDWVGDKAQVKEMQPYYFTLEPVFKADGTETLTGFSSPKMRSVLREERFKADDYLQAKNIELYTLLNTAYTAEYSNYMKTGNSSSFVNAVNAETNTEVLNALNTEVFGYEPMTVKELIFMNLQ
jgi:hypothetical protein